MSRASAVRSLARSWDAHGAWQRAAWVTGALVALVVVALVLVAAPLRDSIARTRESVAERRLVLDVARARTAENATLARTQAPAGARDPRAAIDRAFAEEAIPRAAGDARGGVAALRIGIDDAPFDKLVRALDKLARDGVRVTEATLTARVDAGTVRAELTFGR
jgi:type II secretory pathway component PulM